MRTKGSLLVVMAAAISLSLGSTSPAMAVSHDHDFTVDLEIEAERLELYDHTGPVEQLGDGPQLTVTCSGWDEGWEEVALDYYSGYASATLQQRGRVVATGYAWFSCSSSTNDVPLSLPVHWEYTYGVRPGRATVDADIKFSLSRLVTGPDGPIEEYQTASDSDSQRVVVKPERTRDSGTNVRKRQH